LGSPYYLPIIIFCFFVAALVWHVFISMAVGAIATSPGWYLHVIMPFIAPTIGIALYQKLKMQNGKKTVICMVFYALIFQMINIWSELSLFAGCSIKGDDKYYLFPNNMLCLDQLDLIFQRLQITGSPYLACLSLAAGYGLLCILLFKIIKRIKTPKKYNQ
jgi:hypothetical protein